MELQNKILFNQIKKRLDDAEECLYTAEKTQNGKQNALSYCYSMVQCLQLSMQIISSQNFYGYDHETMYHMRRLYQWSKEMSDVEEIKKHCSKDHPEDVKISNEVLVVVDTFKDIYNDLRKIVTPTNVKVGDLMHFYMREQEKTEDKPGMEKVVTEVVSQGLQIEGCVIEPPIVKTKLEDERHFMATPAPVNFVLVDNDEDAAKEDHELPTITNAEPVKHDREGKAPVPAKRKR